MAKEEIMEALKNIMHPEINASLIDLGMIKDVVIKESVVTLILNLPYEGVPIKYMLIDEIKGSLKKFDIEIKIETREMNPAERQKFMEMAQKYWKF